jgi:hypothetical protein
MVQQENAGDSTVYVNEGACGKLTASILLMCKSLFHVYFTDHSEQHRILCGKVCYIVLVVPCEMGSIKFYIT